jgi:hypothetical protein
MSLGTHDLFKSTCLIVLKLLDKKEQRHIEKNKGKTHTVMSLSGLKLLLVRKASVCSLDLRTATSMYKARSPHTGSHPLCLGRLFNAMAKTVTAVLFCLKAGEVEDDLTGF